MRFNLPIEKLMIGDSEVKIDEADILVKIEDIMILLVSMNYYIHPGLQKTIKIVKRK